MTAPTQRQTELERAFQDAWKEFGDGKSTEFLIGIVCDRCSAEYDEVIDALVAVNDEHEGRQ